MAGKANVLTGKILAKSSLLLSIAIVIIMFNAGKFGVSFKNFKCDSKYFYIKKKKKNISNYYFLSYLKKKSLFCQALIFSNNPITVSTNMLSN